MNLFNKRRDYQKNWINNQKYIDLVYKEQKDAPIVEPTIKELKNALMQHEPKSVLEVGCGWGRLMKPINEEFNLTGCDINNQYLLEAQKKGLTVFHGDIVIGIPSYRKADILYCCGTIMYFNDKQIEEAITNMIGLAKKKIIIFEWADTCERILKVVNEKLILNSNKLELHIIKNKGLEEYKKKVKTK